MGISIFNVDYEDGNVVLDISDNLKVIYNYWGSFFGIGSIYSIFANFQLQFSQKIV